MEMFSTARIVEACAGDGEDRAAVMELPCGIDIVVADGAGGISGGAEAADIVVRIAAESAPSIGKPRRPAAWRRLLAEMDRAVMNDPRAGQTTVVVAHAWPEGVAGASVGDSGALLISRAGCVDLTAGQQRKPFVGSGAARPVAFAVPRFDGVLLAATDGLLKYADHGRIEEAARRDDVASAARDLVDLVRLGWGQLQDDVAVVLCRREGPAVFGGD
jgi:serine/threonine protein phosphatase PrpC